eukprot:TRINITY_DN46108_c0_g1_i1.p1 TRINITY_DN46108_c0_g1~~TRINITY_DN46108_c0_g1_i1.p1  ORF type:complete len:122 (-),score=18.15 TRINITY_DN46108_c0_g1_i1:501-866(-)
MLCGGFRNPTDRITEDIRSLCSELKPEAERMVHTKFSTFEPVLWSSQVVAGVNYAIKVKVEEPSHFIHLHVFQPLFYTEANPKITQIETGKTEDDKLVDVPKCTAMPLPQLNLMPEGDADE